MHRQDAGSLPPPLFASAFAAAFCAFFSSSSLSFCIFFSWFFVILPSPTPSASSVATGASPFASILGNAIGALGLPLNCKGFFAKKSLTTSSVTLARRSWKPATYYGQISKPVAVSPLGALGLGRHFTPVHFFPRVRAYLLEFLHANGFELACEETSSLVVLSYLLELIIVLQEKCEILIRDIHLGAATQSAVFFRGLLTARESILVDCACVRDWIDRTQISTAGHSLLLLICFAVSRIKIAEVSTDADIFEPGCVPT